MYNCALKNLQEEGGLNQKALIDSIENWYKEQSQLSARLLMDSYTVYEDNSF